jgi:protease I
LEKAGAKCLIVSPKDGPLQAFKHHDKADKFDVDLALAKADPNEFDAVLLPGRRHQRRRTPHRKRAQQFVQEIDRAGKPILVICHGGWILVSAGLVKRRTMTSWPTLEDDIRNAGGNWKDQKVIRDRNG